MKSISQLALCLLCFSLLQTSGYLTAQVTTGNISGVVTDETNAVLPGVTLTVVNVDTNIQRTVISDDEGRYRAANLNPGTYDVRGELTGFKTAVRSGILLTIGREAQVDLLLSVGEMTEKVVVTGDAPLVDTTTGTLGNLVSRDQIANLPLNGRSYQDLMGLQPGVVLIGKAQGDVSQGSGNKYSVSGARYSFNQFMVDGSEINDHRDSTPASVAGTVMGVEAVREFKVLTNSYSAEYGRNAGVVMNVVTKSGTNRFHGAVYEFLRNDALDAKNFFTVGDKLPFKRNQFGVAVDGPVIRDKTFFMANYEGLRQRLEVPVSFVTLTADARRGVLPGRPAVNVNPGIRPYLDLYSLPTPGGRDFNNGTADFFASSGRPIDEDYFIVKLDHQLTTSTSLMGRYSHDTGESNISNFGFDVFGKHTATRSENFLVQGKTIFTPRLLNTAAFSLNRPKTTEEGTQLKKVIPTIEGNSTFGSIGTVGLSSLGQGGHQKQSMNTLEVSDSVVNTRGKHSLKFGGSFKRFYAWDDSTPSTDGGNWSFASVEDILNNRVESLSAVSLGFEPSRVRQNLIGFYIQDDFAVHKRLTLNLGLRYEFITVPYEIRGRQANLRSLLDTKMTVGKPMFENPSLKNFAPRVGFAWDVLGDGKTSLRGGFGIFHGQLLNRAYGGSFNRNPPFFFVARLIPPPSLPITAAQRNLLTSVPSGSLETQPFEFHPHTPYMMQYNLSLQREVLPSTVVTAAYVGSRGVHLTRAEAWNGAYPSAIIDGKKFFAAGLPRRNPAFGSMNYFLTDADSYYHALQLGITRRLSGGLQLQGSYSFSRAIDTGTEFGIGGAFRGGISKPQDPDNGGDVRSLSDIHVAQTFVFNSSYQLPWGSGWTGIAGKLAAGWQLSNIVKLATGSPFSLELGFDRARNLESTGQRPNLRSGFSNDPVLGGPNQYFDLNAFELQPTGFFGNLGRNTLSAPGLATVDISLLRNIGVPLISEDFNIQFRAEFFNVFNRPNFDLPGPSPQPNGGVRMLDRQGNRLAQAAKINATVGTSRQIQLALKILF